jgi:hypothetical protein
MAYLIIDTNEIQQLATQIFGNRKITAITGSNTVLLTVAEQKNVNQNAALDKLFGMFQNTNLQSSDDFAKNKEYEKRLEEEKFKHE